MKTTLFAAAATAALLLGGCADTTPGGKAVRARHEHFEELGKAMKAIDTELKAGTAGSATVKVSADTIAELAPRVKTWFPAGSGPQDGKRTDAKAEIWTRQAEFGAAATRLEAAAVALRAAAQGGDANLIGGAVRTVGAACKNCHDAFKKD